MQADGGVIFLDMDGVLNRKAHSTHIRLDDDLVERLRGLVITTGACLVLTSCWRHHLEYIRCLMYRSGIPAECVLGATPGASIGYSDLLPLGASESIYESRAEEIKDWIRSGHSHVTRFAVLEPRAIASGDTLAAHHVMTRSDVGLSEEDAARAKALLARPDGGFYMWSVTGLRAASNPTKPTHKPGAKVAGGICKCQMLGSTLLIECELCKRVRAEGDKEAGAAAAPAPGYSGGLSRASSKTTLKAK
jgi:hypothetical protein